jgi:class 3 adenylate cyclase/tetratricopeptide (TPR) repeat protein
VNTCPSCGADALPGERFCGQCGASLLRACPSCGAENPPDHRFCGSCGTALTGESAPARQASQSVSERRLVSVLFADLVGFTSLSEHRDPEEVRELLSRYFERCRTLIERYGGTVEKFIGDAVMAVWGTPVAREDDAERAVRAALALVQRVQALGEEVGMPELRVRAGVLTGNAAVEVGAEGEGMVLGDSVNTASRLQSIAAPGTVLVDDGTRRAAEAAIAFEDAGTHEVKGREQAVHAWTALRVVAGTGGARRSAGLEAPFVGRQHELQTIIEAGEESAQKRCARLVAVVGEAGSGKSRLLWEFFKYLDGIKEVRFWHQGRCLSYGEGVAYWALAEMVRFRARIQEEEEPASAREKLRAAVEQYVPDERERRLVEPRLAHLLRLEEREEADRADLFSGWRLFFERLSEESPVILAFEDLQWADSGLLDFVDYLLEWSAEFPIFVLALGRPELRERRPAWEPLNLVPLEPQAIAHLLDGLAPGLPEELVARVVERAEGIPLYAVETLRMLQDRGALALEGARYVVKGDVSQLEVPETLHALVASRLDGLSASERSLLQDASVLGQSFTAAAVAALSGFAEAEVAQTLDGLVAKQVLARDDDPRSPEQGQYLFLQALLRTVAYGTLSRRSRKAKHLAAARHLERTWPGEARDIAEVLASHYMEAISADPEAEDVATLRGLAREKLTAAGQAAASLALGPEADRYFEHAAHLADHDSERAALLEHAGHALWKSGDGEAADKRLRSAIELYRKSDAGKASGAIVSLAKLLRHHLGRLDEARGLLEPFLAQDEGAKTVVRAQALAELSAVVAFGGELDEALPLLEDALTILEHEQAWPALADALVTRGIYLIWRGRQQEGVGVLRHALSLAEEHDATSVALRARMNLTQISLESDQLSRAVEQAREVLTLARERGDRALERKAHGILTWPLAVLGRWDEALSIGAPLLAEEHYVDALFAAGSMVWLAWARGDDAMIERCRALALDGRGSTYVDTRVCAESTLARDAVERGEPAEALTLTRNARNQRGISGDALRESFAISVEAAVAAGDETAIAEVERFVAELPPALATPLLRAGRARLQAELAHQAGDDGEARRFEEEALSLLRSVGVRAMLVPALLERASRHQDREALAEARTICEELRATRWLERVDELSGVAA